MSNFTPEQLASPGFVRSRNQGRIEAVWKNSYDVAIYDFDGTIARHGEINPAILDRQAQLLIEGAVLTVSSGRGESLHPLYTYKMAPLLQQKGADLASVNLYTTTRNGAVTEHAFTGGIIDEHPFHEDLYRAVSEHPLVQAIQTLTPLSHMGDIQAFYTEQEKKYGIRPHRNTSNQPGLLHDVHRTSGSMYKMNMYFDPKSFGRVYREKGDIVEEAIRVVDYYSGGIYIDSAPTMGALLRQRLEEEGLFVNPQSFATDKEIDITLPNVDKNTGYDAIKQHIETTRGKQKVLIATIGDSPQHNDGPLLRNGVGLTNVNYFDPDGPIALDIPGITDQIKRSQYFFDTVQLIRNY